MLTQLCITYTFSLVCLCMGLSAKSNQMDDRSSSYRGHRENVERCVCGEGGVDGGGGLLLVSIGGRCSIVIS